MDALNSIELTLKTPNQRFNDIQLQCQEDWTVKRLKEHLEDVYPSKPKSSAQKLIYLGKLLQDHVKLKEVFSSWSARTLHIVCHDSHNESLSTQCNQETPSTSSRPNQASSEIDSPNTDGVRLRNNPLASTSTPQQFPPTQQTPTISQPQQPQQQPYHQQWNQQWNQMQMQQYYMQMQHWQQAMSSGQWPYQQAQTNMYNVMNNPPTTPSMTSTPPVTPSTPNTPPAAAPQPEQLEQPPVRQPAEGRNNVPMNAGPGGAIMQDDGNNDNNPANRDWLDWVYMSMRGLMLLSIIYFYSSTSRFVLVTLLGFIVYLYQTGWFTPRRVEPPMEAQTPQRNGDEVDGNAENGEDTNDNNTTTELNENELPVEPPRPSAFKILCTFVISFVTSLVPATAPPLQQN